ncbi:DinI family protein [Yersinia thracica]|uniref:DinI family protein n=2 Tax=Yersinia thracica TaxID=2890319 RepID=A0A0T9NGK1_9GAMM|nr:DinI family protein [Yersinia thracica]
MRHGGDDCQLFIISTIINIVLLTVPGGAGEDKNTVEEILQDTWESADDWFQAGFLAVRPVIFRPLPT